MELRDLNRLHETDTRARLFVYWAKALLLGGGVFEAVPIFQRLAGRSSHADVFVKTAIDSHSTATTPDLAFARLGRPFLDLSAKQTVLGRLSGTVPLVPYLPSPVMSTSVLADFVAESQPMPAVRLDSDLVTLFPSKLGIIIGVTEELLQSSDSRATQLFERHLQRVVRDGEDAQLLGSAAAVVGERPAGLLAGLSTVGAGSPQSLDDDLVALWQAVRGGEPDRPYFITSGYGAVHLASLRNEDGAVPFPNVSPVGGTLMGVPQLVSKAAGNKLILVDAAALGVSDGGIVVDVSRNASIQMDSTPAVDASSVIASAFQANLSFLKIIRFVHWQLAYADGAAFTTLPISA